ncbi:MAG: hypothetical protein JXQ73_13110 [Phycisphaerae bacterium]|nr:hypothetical protein [Phycisphaerae bacterium]
MESKSTSSAASEDSRRDADTSGVDQDALCVDCGYNLRGLTTDRCPECGRAFDRASLIASQIPWVVRRQIGTIRAYWRTVWMVILRNARFCNEAGVPLSYRDAQLFRWVTILHVYLPFLIATLVACAFRPLADPFVDYFFKTIWPLAALHACLILFLLGITGVPSYFFHPACLTVEQQDRAIALSYYTCAPLAVTTAVWLVIALVWLPIKVAGINISADPFDLLMALERAPTPLRVWVFSAGILGFGLMAMQPALWWWALVDLAKRSMPDTNRSRLVALAVPILWVAISLVTLLIIPLLVFYVALIAVSF